MQLQMTAPMDIGMEQHDDSLGFGQEDVFDLTGVEKGLRKQGGAAMLVGDEDMPESDESAADDSDGDEGDEILDPDEERERKVAGLEVDLDGMYDIYQERMRERDAKFKVKEARKKSGQLEEWNGIQEKDSDDEDSDNTEEGGWEKMEEAKAKAGDESSSDESDDGDDDEGATLGQKRRGNEPVPPSPKRAKLLTNLEPPRSAAQTSRAAQVWFSQDFFADMDDFDNVEDGVDEDVSMDVGAKEDEDGWQDEVRSCVFLCLPDFGIDLDLGCY